MHKEREPQVFINKVYQELDLENQLEQAIYKLLKAKDMKRQNIPNKFEKQMVLINEAREFMDEWETEC